MDIYRANDWDAKVTMIKLSAINRNRKDQGKVQKVEEEMQRKKLSMEKKEEMKKQKTTEKEMESIARNAMKLKLKAKKDSWKGELIFILVCLPEGNLFLLYAVSPVWF